MRKRLVAGMLVLGLVGGCSYGDSGPGPTPGTMDDVIGAIVLQGITVQHLTSGDAGCSTASLHENAVHMTLRVGSESASHEVYFLNWKNQAKYDAAAADFAACIADYQVLNPGAPVTRLDAYPWRAYGPGWTTPLYTKLVNALTSVDGQVSPGITP